MQLIDRQQKLAAFSADLGSAPWRMHHLALSRLQVVGNAQARRLCLWVDVFLVNGSPADEAQVQFTAQLHSRCWPTPAAGEPVLPLHREVDLAPELPNGPEVVLDYELIELSESGRRMGAEVFWLKYLHGDAQPMVLDNAFARSGTVGEQLRSALQRWLVQTLKVNTVAGADACARTGPAGCFGPLAPQVLERTGEPDLALDATLLAQVDDALDANGEPTAKLLLYGERHGRWLLHRRRESPKPRRPAAASLAWHCEVLIAPDAGSLIQLAGLGPLEKRLFQQAGVLPPVLLAEPDSCQDGAADAPQWVDLAGVPDRSRVALLGIVALARQGRLSPVDVDMLARLARHLSKAR